MSETIPSWARIGAKVVCINGGTTNSLGFDYLGRVPVTGGVYTVTKVVRETGDRYWLLVLAGFEVGRDCGWNIARFRPLVSQADDIATHFAYLLDTRAPELV